MIQFVLLAVTALARNATGTSYQIPVAPAESLHVEVTGQGPPIVLIPGLFGGGYTFRNLVPWLGAEGFQAIVVEPLGMGTSSRPAGADYSMTAQADRVAAVLDSLHTGPVLVFAHSLGGAVAFRLAYRHPELLRALVSEEGGPTETATTPEFRHALKYAFLIRLIHGVGIVRGKVKNGLRDASGDPAWITDAVVHGYTADAERDLSGTLRVYQAIARAHEPDSLAPHLAEIRCPVLLMVGTAPHAGDVSPEEVALLAERLPSFAVDSVPGVGHYVHEERLEAVLAAVGRVAHDLASAHDHPTGSEPSHADRAGR